MATVNLGFENNLWEMADKLRGNIEASEYKHVVLGLIFLKYISDAFEERYNELVEEGEGFEEDIDAYTEENVFFVPKEARWESRPEIDKTKLGELIDLFSFKVGDKEARAKDVLGRVYEYFLGKFGSSEGEFYTLPSIVKLLVEMIEPYKGRVYDIITTKTIQFNYPILKAS
jgi:type I restriction enzyme M protein